MADSRILKQSEKPNHKLIKALSKKGYTDITIQWDPATSRSRGFTAETKENNWIKLGPCMVTSLIAIEKLETKFNTGDSVKSSSKYSNGKIGTVWKISDYGVHVNFGTVEEPSHQVFHFKPTHHMQSPISDLSLVIKKPLKK